MIQHKKFNVDLMKKIGKKYGFSFLDEPCKRNSITITAKNGEKLTIDKDFTIFDKSYL